MGTPDWARFLKYVEKQENGCWLWIGAIRGNGRNEYGAFWVNGRTQRSHIVSYVWTYGEPNCDLHHICEQSLCVNPEHVTPASSGQPRHRHVIPGMCKCGLPFSGTNNRGDGICHPCATERTRRYLDANRDAVNAKRRAQREHIVYDPRPCLWCGTTYQPMRSDSRYCTERACINDRQRANRNKRLA
jgi:hypothetical protein